MKSNLTDRPATSSAILHSWTSGQEPKPIPCLDSRERKTEGKHNGKTPAANSAFRPHSSITVNYSGKGFFRNEQSFLLSINISHLLPSPAPLTSQTIPSPEPDGHASDLQFSEAAEPEIPML